MQRLVDLLAGQPGLFVGELPHRSPGRVRFLGDLGRVVVADQRVERGGHADRALDVALCLLPVRLETGQRLVDEDARGVCQQPHALQHVPGHHRQHHVEVELPPLAADRDRLAVPRHLRADLDDGLADDRVDLARHDRASRLDRRQHQLAQPGLRSRGQQPDVVGDLHQRRGQRGERPGGEDVGVTGALRLEVVLRLPELRPGEVRQLARHPRAELGMGVQPGADRGAADGQLAQPRQRRLDALDRQLDLARVAAELLTEPDRHRIHQVRAADLHHVVELLGLPAEHVVQVAERRDQVALDRQHRRDVQHGRDHVVGRLPEIDFVVRVNPPAQLGRGDRGDHLVGVHVRRRSGARLEDVDRKLVVQLAIGHGACGMLDGVGDVRRQQPQLAIDPRRGKLRPDRAPG